MALFNDDYLNDMTRSELKIWEPNSNFSMFCFLALTAVVRRPLRLTLSR